MLTQFLIWSILVFSSLCYSGTDSPSTYLQEFKGLPKDGPTLQAFSERLQVYLSKEKDPALRSSEQFKKLLEVQTRLVKFQRLSQRLISSNCRLDPLSQDPEAQQLLSAALEAPECNSYSGDFLSQHPTLNSLIKDIEIIEDHTYSGTYTINDKGELTFPWEKGQTDLGHLRANLPSADSAPQDERFRDLLFRESLKDTFSTYLDLKTSYLYDSEKYFDAEKFVSDFCNYKKTYLGTVKWTKASVHCTPAMKKMFLGKTKEAMEAKTPRSPVSATNEVNAKLKKLNVLSEKLKVNGEAGLKAQGRDLKAHQEKHSSTAAKVGAPAKLTQPKFSDEAQAKRDYTEYRRLHTELISRGPGLMAMTKALRPKLGLRPFSPYEFLQPHPTITEDEFMKGIEEAREHVQEHSSELLSTYQSKAPTPEKIAQFIELNPLAAGRVLLEDPSLAPLACSGLKLNTVKEMNQRQVRDVVNWGGLIVGGALALSGVGTLPMALVGAVTTAPDLTFQTQDILKHDRTLSASFSENDGLRAQTAQENLEDAKTGLLVSAAVVAVGHGIDVRSGLYKGRSPKPILKAVDERLEFVKAVQTKDRLKPYKHKYDGKVSLDPKYKGEEHGLKPGWKVKYLTPEEKMKRQAFVFDGKLIDVNGKYLDSEINYIFILDHNGGLYVTNEQFVGHFHHSSLNAGGDVASAGEITVKNGRIVELTNYSGHYKPSAEDHQRTLERLRELGADMSAVKEKTYKFDPVNVELLPESGASP